MRPTRSGSSSSACAIATSAANRASTMQVTQPARVAACGRDRIARGDAGACTVIERRNMCRRLLMPKITDLALRTLTLPRTERITYSEAFAHLGCRGLLQSCKHSEAPAQVGCRGLSGARA